MRPSSEKMCANSSLQEGGGSVFILLWAVSGHHYLTLQKERCKQMLAAHLAATVAEAAARTGEMGDRLRQRLALLGSTSCVFSVTKGPTVSSAAATMMHEPTVGPAVLTRQKRGCFAMVITQREAISVQDALGRKLNKHWRQSFHKAAWPKQTENRENGCKS